MGEAGAGLITDFTEGAVGYRFRIGRRRGDALPRAAGFTKGRTPDVVDATAGLGRDAFLLASLGARVTLIERSPEIFVLLQEALARAAAIPLFADTVSRMTLLHADARDLLPRLEPETVLVDPMHPARSKSALVKKEIRCVREIVGPDEDAAELIRTALASARDRVVLKWPVRGAPIKGTFKPSYRITGKTIRYDVFMTRRASTPFEEERGSSGFL
jgi:16S rRNA (guanine1516-N2)-methyltransferase